MDKKIMEKLEEGYCKVLQHYAEKGMESPESVETTKAALSGMVKMKMLEEMEKFGEESSNRSYRSYDGDGSYRRSHAMGQYEGGGGGGGSYRRGRSHDGYGYEGGRSGHGMRERLEEMMEEAGSERERRAIEEALQKM